MSSWAQDMFPLDIRATRADWSNKVPSQNLGGGLKISTPIGLLIRLWCSVPSQILGSSSYSYPPSKSILIHSSRHHRLPPTAASIAQPPPPTSAAHAHRTTLPLIPVIRSLGTHAIELGNHFLWSSPPLCQGSREAAPTSDFCLWSTGSQSWRTTTSLRPCRPPHRCLVISPDASRHPDRTHLSPPRFIVGPSSYQHLDSRRGLPYPTKTCHLPSASYLASPQLGASHTRPVMQ
jgi:hypothetical protein